MNKGILYWLTGLPGAGKTTIGTALYYRLRQDHQNVVLLDGDNLKDIFGMSHGIDYSVQGRRDRAMQYAHMCKLLTDQHMIVICCTISMNEEVRAWNRAGNDRYAEVYLEVPRDILEQRDYRGMYTACRDGRECDVPGLDMDVEIPENPDIRILNDGTLSVDECVDRILAFTPSTQHMETDDTEYWNRFYQGENSAPSTPSAFAVEILSKYLEKGRRLLELGCGNGRDSIFFDTNGISVVALDSSSSAIAGLNKWRNSHKSSALFACDDFTSSNAIYQQSFDYCYSRFTLHSITELQEIDVIRNVANCLNEGGYFFIEVRSVNDDIYGMGEPAGRDAFIYNGHYRRFIRKSEMEDRLRTYGGFIILFSEEDRSFAAYHDMNPLVIRIIARKYTKTSN